MGPEWTALVDGKLDGKIDCQELAKMKEYISKNPSKIDIYAIGIILADLICNPGTQMETMRMDDALKSRDPTLPKGYKLENTIEGALLLELVSPDPSKRPSARQIQSDWLHKWKESLEVN